VGTINYTDFAGANGVVREVNIDSLSLEEVRLRVNLATSTSNWAMLRLKLQRGAYHVSMEYWPLTENGAVLNGLRCTLTNALKFVWNEANAVDAGITPNYGPQASTVTGFGAGFGQTANGPLVGWLYQNKPSPAQPSGANSTDIAIGDSTSLPLGTYRLYAFFAVPFVTAPNLQAEAESGALGTGWSSVADANASAGNAAQAASGTVSGNADLFGTSWVPPVGLYDVWFRVLVASAAGSAAEMTLGLWDTIAGAFVAGGSTTFRANQFVTSYTWVKAASALLLPAGRNVQFRAVTAATLGTTWTIDEAALAPAWSATKGVGSFPGDLYQQFLFEKTVAWARG
jgi:hypothetical protein